MTDKDFTPTHTCAQQLGDAELNPVYHNSYVSPLEMVQHVAIGLVELVEASREDGRDFPFCTLEVFAWYLHMALDGLNADAPSRYTLCALNAGDEEPGHE